MKFTLRTLFSVFALLAIVPASAVTLGVTANATPRAGLFDYTYSFAVSGSPSTAVDNVFLGSNDLSPLDVAFTKNGSPTAAWSWLGNDMPTNYLQFFSFSDALGNGDQLGVSFESAFAPVADQFAVGLDSSSGIATDRVDGLLGPGSVPAIPEPSVWVMMLVGLGAARYIARSRRP